MKFFKLGLILSVVALNGTSVLADEAQPVTTEAIVVPTDVTQPQQESVETVNTPEQEEVKEEKKEETGAHVEPTVEATKLANPFADASVIPTPAFNAEEEAVRLFQAAAGLSALEASVKQDTRLAEFIAVVEAIRKAPKNALNYEVQYKKLTAAIRHRFGANLLAILKFVKA